MSLFALASLKGAPGTTTLACLVAATWPLDRRVVVAECDPSGGDLASRFELSTTKGCLSLATAARRDPVTVVVDPHVQRLPGGLEVLVGGSSSEISLAQSVTRDNVNQAVVNVAGAVDVVADLGRLMAPYDDRRELLQEARAVGVLIGPDHASVAHAVDQRELLTELCGDRISFLLVGRGTCGPGDVESLTGIRVLAEVPIDPAAAAVASGATNGARRLGRSVLVRSARRIADSFASMDGRRRGPRTETGHTDHANHTDQPVQSWRPAEPDRSDPTGWSRQDEGKESSADSESSSTLKVLP